MAKDKEKVENKKNKILIRVRIFLLIALVLASTYFFIDKIENFVNFAYNGEAPSTQIDESGLKVHFIDVDQADAILIEFPTGEKMLIDSGDNKSASQEKLTTYLNKINFKTEGGEKVLDYFLLTHSDADHIGGATSIFENFKVKTCIRPNIKSKSETAASEEAVHETQLYDKVIAALSNEVLSSGCISITSAAGLEIKSNAFVESNLNKDKNTWELSFLTPMNNCLPYKEGSTKYNYNNYSPIAILSYMNKKIMFTGDAEKEVEEDLIEYYTDWNRLNELDVDILKVGHHGSDSSSTPEFLKYVKPEYAIIEVGKDNKHGHPHEDTLKNLQSAGLSINDIYRTDNNGTILVGVSTAGELSLISDHVQYTTIKIEWWYIFVGGNVISAIIIFLPLLSKKNQKKVKKALKNSKKD